MMKNTRVFPEVAPLHRGQTSHLASGKATEAKPNYIKITILY